MKKTFSGELLWYFSPALRRDLPVEAQLPQAIELRLERLRLLEAIRTAGGVSAGRTPFQAATAEIRQVPCEKSRAA